MLSDVHKALATQTIELLSSEMQSKLKKTKIEKKD